MPAFHRTGSLCWKAQSYSALPGCSWFSVSVSHITSPLAFCRLCFLPSQICSGPASGSGRTLTMHAVVAARNPQVLDGCSRENHLVRAALRHEGRSRQFGTSCSCATIVAHGCLLMAFCVQEKKPKRKQLQQKHLLRLLGYWNYTVSTSALGELQKYESLVTRRQENDRGRGRERERERER